MSFHVGQKVVCVDDDFTKYLSPYDETMPKRGCIYTVSETLTVNGINYVRLFEIKNKPHLYMEAFGEVCFGARRFRPIQERSTETGMAILRKLLNPVSCVEQKEQHGTHSVATSVSTER